MKEQKLLHSIRGAAAILGISTRQLHKFRVSGQIQVRRIGGRVFVTQFELQRFISVDQPEPTALKAAA